MSICINTKSAIDNNTFEDKLCVCLKMLGFLFFAFVIQNIFGAEKKANTNPPNVILILADDLGYGDLSCYGQQKMHTPNIDALAASGMLFTQHYAGAPVCAPSRNAILTGRHTGHTTIRGNKKANKYGEFPLAATDTTLAQLFKTNGYTTGMFGKWGLGVPHSTGDVIQKGFDVFFGYYGQLQAHNHYPEKLWSNNQQVAIPENKKYSNKVYAPLMIQDSLMQFIERNKSNPFFLFMSTILPHAELAPPDSILKKYVGKLGEEKPYQGIKTVKFATKFGAYDAQKNPKAAYAAMVELLDKQVGDIVDKLKKEGIYDNTIILFTSDNGAHQEGGAQPDYFKSNADFRGYKRDLYEGGIRMPLLIHWSDKIKQCKSDILSASWDLMPTLAEIIHAKVPKNIDGISLLPTLLQQPQMQQHPYLYWEFHEQGGKQAVRMGKWKGVKLKVQHAANSRFELYDIEKDPSEKNDVANQYPEVVKTLSDILKNAHTPSGIFPFRKLDSSLN